MSNRLGSAGRLSLPAEPRGRREAVCPGKPEAFRTSGGRAACRGFDATLGPGVGNIEVVSRVILPNELQNPKVGANGVRPRAPNRSPLQPCDADPAPDGRDNLSILSHFWA